MLKIVEIHTKYIPLLCLQRLQTANYCRGWLTNNADFNPPFPSRDICNDFGVFERHLFRPIWRECGIYEKAVMFALAFFDASKIVRKTHSMYFMKDILNSNLLLLFPPQLELFTFRVHRGFQVVKHDHFATTRVRIPGCRCIVTPFQELKCSNSSEPSEPPIKVVQFPISASIIPTVPFLSVGENFALGRGTSMTFAALRSVNDSLALVLIRCDFLKSQVLIT
jgi:hypothetical protein